MKTSPPPPSGEQGRLSLSEQTIDWHITHIFNSCIHTRTPAYGPPSHSRELESHITRGWFSVEYWGGIQLVYSTGLEEGYNSSVAYHERNKTSEWCKLYITQRERDMSCILYWQGFLPLPTHITDFVWVFFISWICIRKSWIRQGWIWWTR